MVSSSFPQSRTEQHSVDMGMNSSSFQWAVKPQQLLQRMQVKLEDILLGKQAEVKQVLVCMLAGGHLLLEDVPGVGKTMLATSIARLLGGQFHRIQFTSDLLPADIVGGMVLDRQDRGLVFRPGPIMANVVLGDELNRSSPRTQSALLEALEDRSVSIEGHSYALPQPFVFIATQNPLQYEGTHGLPEAQRDRFMMQLSLGYPSKQDEMSLLVQYAEGTRYQTNKLRPVMSDVEWMQMQKEIQYIYVHPSLIEYMADVAHATRTNVDCKLGLSPRALRDWLRAGQAVAYFEGRSFILPDDLLAQAVATLSHRIELQGRANNSYSKEQFISKLLLDIPLSKMDNVGKGRGQR